jgi:hypothetical protein
VPTGHETLRSAQIRGFPTDQLTGECSRPASLGQSFYRCFGQDYHRTGARNRKPHFSHRFVGSQEREKAVGVPEAQHAEAYLDSTLSTPSERNEADEALSRAAAEKAMRNAGYVPINRAKYLVREYCRDRAAASPRASSRDRPRCIAARVSAACACPSRARPKPFRPERPPRGRNRGVSR